MSGLGIGSGLKALLAAQASLDTIGNNLANVNTPGYSRQRVDLASSLSVVRYGLRMGTGVDALGVSRVVDEVLEGRILGQLGTRARLEQAWGAKADVELLFGELEGNGVGAGLDLFFSAATQLAASPADAILQGDLVNTGKTLAQRFRDLDRGLVEHGAALGGTIEATVDEVNAIAGRIATLNGQLGALEGSGGPAHELLDERQRLVKELAELVDVQTTVDSQGNHSVFVGTSLLVSGDRALELGTQEAEGDALELVLEGTPHALEVRGGKLGALLAQQGTSLDDVRAGVDELAQALILATNRAHSTGVPGSGSFHSLYGTNALVDADGSGTFLDDRLADAGLPFDVTDGELVVNVVDEDTGDVTSRTLTIDAESTTVSDFLAELDGIDGLRAWITDEGYLAVEADTGYGFDFSNRLDPSPDSAGTFGGGQASLGSAFDGPYSITDGSTLEIAVPAGGGPTAVVTFDSADFADPSAVSAQELADVLNADAGFAGAGLVASDAGGYLHLGTLDSGSAQSLELTGGSALTDLGLDALAGVPVTGSDLASEVSVTGEYTGDESDSFLFQVVGDGTVGTTPGLAVEVYDSSGGLVATLDVGEGYTPGETLDVVDGIEVSFGLGGLSQTANDRFALDAVADSDTSDVLVALGVNGFFVGHDAATIDVRADLEDHPDRIASSASGTPGGNHALLELLGAETAELALLEGQTLGQAYGELVGDVGFEVAALEGAYESADSMLSALEARRESISGVNTDEELVDLVRFEQAYAAAAQYLSVVSRLEDDLLQLV